MSKITEARQTLVKAICKQLKKYGARLNVFLQPGDTLYFYAYHYGANKEYTCEMGFRYACFNDDLLIVRTKPNGVVEVVSPRTKVKHLELAMKYMPVVEKFLEVEAEIAGLGTV